MLNDLNDDLLSIKIVLSGEKSINGCELQAATIIQT